jgi:uncharacterized membrane protein
MATERAVKTWELATAQAARVAIAELDLKAIDVAALAGVTPARLSDVLHRRRPYSKIIRVRLERAIAEAARYVPVDDDADLPAGAVRLPVPRVRRLR